MQDLIYAVIAVSIGYAAGYCRGYRAGFWAGALKEFRRWRLIPAIRHERWKRIIERTTRQS